MILTILAGVCCSIMNLIFILGIMSSSGLCVSCKEPLTPPAAKFCVECGAPQTRPQLCIHCKAQLPSNSQYCSKCGKPQSHPKQQESSVKWCRNCKTQLSPDAAFCTKCGEAQMTSLQELVKSSCILCKRSLKGTPQNCNFCSAPQDFHELSKRSFKECERCCRSIFKETKLCIYQDCRALQKTPPSTPAHEEVGQSFSQNAPINTTNVMQFHEDQITHLSHPLQLPQDSSEMSLQPTDKPTNTKEQMLQIFKSPSPEHDGCSTDRPDSASTSSAAVRVSETVTSQKVNNTYGILGEANDNGSSSVPKKRKPSDHDYDSLETPSSKIKPEALGSIEVHNEDWVMLNQEEILHDMENLRNEQGNKPEDKKKEEEIESQGNNEDSTKGEIKPKNNDTAIPKQPADGARENEIAGASDSESESSSSNTSHKNSLSSASSHSNSTPGTPALNRSSTGTGNAPSPKNDAKPVDVHKPPVEESSSTYKPADTDGEKNGINGNLGESGKNLEEKDRESDDAKDEANGKGAAEDSGKGRASGKVEGGGGKDGGDGKAEGGDRKADGGDGKTEGGERKAEKSDGKADRGDGKADGGDGKEGAKGGASEKGTDGGKSGNAKSEVSADGAVNSGTSGNVTGENFETTGKGAGGDKGKDRASAKGDDRKGGVGGSGKGGKSAAGGDGGKGGTMEKGGKGTSGKDDEEKSGKGGGKGKGKGKKDESNGKGSGQSRKDKGSEKSTENGTSETSFLGEESKSQNEKKIVPIS